MTASELLVRGTTGRASMRVPVGLAATRLSGVRRLRAAWVRTCEHGVDGLAVVDPLEVDGCDTEVGVSELALNDGERDAFAGHLDRVCVAKRVRRESSPDAGVDGEAGAA